MLLMNFEQPSLLKQRFSKTAVKKDSSVSNILKNIQEIIKPLSKKNIESEEYINKTKKLLMQAGFASSQDDIEAFDLKRMTNTMIAVIFSLILLLLNISTESLLIGALVIYLTYKWPEFYLERKKKEREKEMIKFLPDAVDLLSICVQAGLGLDAAFAKVAEEFSLTSVVVSEEFSRLNKNILSGLSHQDAFKNLTQRNDSQDLQSFVALLIQSDKLGTSISQSLEAFCDSMRTKKKQRIEELSQQASTKMTIPMVLFMLPSIFLIIMYPAIQKIMQNFH